jgi:CheY-like chemotaxis protein
MSKTAFLVEDEGVVALLLESMLSDLGYDIAGPVPRLPQAIEMARQGVFDFAVLDVNLNGAPSFPVAEILIEREIPFVFATGYGAQGIPAHLRHCVVVQKPFKVKQLADAIAAAMDVCARGQA